MVSSLPATLPPLHAVVEDAERGHIRKALNECEGSVGKTADVLGISRKTLWEKMKRLEISALLLRFRREVSEYYEICSL
jgi:DNA-binding NtrC family response regulator